MHTVRISDDMKAVIQRHVAAGAAASDVDFVEEAIRLYAEYLKDDQDKLIAAAEEGIAAIERGDYVTISGPDDVAALQDRVRKRAMVLAEEMRAVRAGKNDEARAEAKAGE